MKYSITKEIVISAYTKALNLGLIKALEQLVEYHKQPRTKTNLQTDLNLTKNQYAGFQQLRYFGLVSHRLQNERRPTQKWIDFIEGKVPCENRVATIENKVLPYNHECRDTDNKKWKLLYIREYDDCFNYKRREEYAQETVRTTQSLFEFA